MHSMVLVKISYGTGKNNCKHVRSNLVHFHMHFLSLNSVDTYYFRFKNKKTEDQGGCPMSDS